MKRFMVLSLLLASAALAQDKKITPLTTQEASDWTELNSGIAATEAWLKTQQDEQDVLRKTMLAVHKIKQGPTVSVEIINGYILYEPTVFAPCITYGGNWPETNLNWVNPVAYPVAR